MVLMIDFLSAVEGYVDSCDSWRAFPVFALRLPDADGTPSFRVSVVKD